MKFARVASFLFAAASVLASTVASGNNSDIMDVLKSFQLTTNRILPQITLVAQNTNKTQVAFDVKPLLNDLTTTAANAAVGSLKDIKSSNGVNRPVDPAVANLVSFILRDITTTLNNAGISSIVHPDEIVALDDPLSIILDVLEAIMMGTLVIVGGSVVGVSALLLLVGLGLVLGALGL
ncbi:hypothetical protein AURDEDRAFT_175290 [Auricularia subglabra TFB-10046 SS5]|uniref:Uncharacterized protein n=1 Tax=Auricularia subglabra (strain TFB-10046 / SS5) TaxID=717982 RepID=J0CXS1_AURST|nr:hypothetical protein AURDEDRAFT_175290 [Auricularia subglabra TFB-10046 SS5]